MKNINTYCGLIVDKTDGSFRTHTVSYTFQCTETGKHYVSLTDGSTDEAGMQKIYAASVANGLR